jgi:hypothetical protein
MLFLYAFWGFQEKQGREAMKEPGFDVMGGVQLLSAITEHALNAVTDPANILDRGFRIVWSDAIISSRSLSISKDCPRR